MFYVHLDITYTKFNNTHEATCSALPKPKSIPSELSKTQTPLNIAKLGYTTFDNIHLQHVLYGHYSGSNGSKTKIDTKILKSYTQTII